MIGAGIVNGLAVTARHFFETAIHALDWPKGAPKQIRQTPLGTERGVFTVQYPEERLALPERARNLPMLIRDKSTGQARCLGCGICVRVCPPQVIWISRARGPDGRPAARLEEFILEAEACMGCGLCAEFCPSSAIKMDHNYELSSLSRASLRLTKADLLVDEEYHAKLHPKDYAQEQEKRRARAEAQSKRSEAPGKSDASGKEATGKKETAGRSVQS